jgi:hypothetical protein
LVGIDVPVVVSGCEFVDHWGSVPIVSKKFAVSVTWE